MTDVGTPPGRMANEGAAASAGQEPVDDGVTAIWNAARPALIVSFRAIAMRETAVYLKTRCRTARLRAIAAVEMLRECGGDVPASFHRTIA